MSFGSIVSSAMASTAPQSLSRRFEAAPHRSVEDLIADGRDRAADHLGVDEHLELHLLARGAAEHLREAAAVLLRERDRRAHLRDHAATALRGEPGDALGDRVELARSSLLHDELEQMDRVRARALPEKVLEERALAL